MGEKTGASKKDAEGEISRWSGFASALRKKDREAFDELLDHMFVFG